MRRSSIELILALLVWLPHASAREEFSVCGTHAATRAEAAALHRRAGAARAAAGTLARAAPRAGARDIGEVAVIEDAGDIVAPPHLFDLAFSTVMFVPARAGAACYRWETGGPSYEAEAASGGARSVRLSDDDSAEVSLPFGFPFFGATYASVFVNSDGNLTFGEADGASSARSLGRLTAGPPRLAPFFGDLDPSQPLAEVRVLASEARVVVSWVSVPEYAAEGTGPRSTFQVRLFPSGRIEFAYAGTGSTSAVVGISPGGSNAEVSLVSFRAGGDGESSGTLAERFTGTREIDIYAAAARFYQTHEDAYDYLVFFNNMGVAAAPGALAYEATVRTLNRTGYGESSYDNGAQFGSPRRLQSILNMGPLSQYPASPDSRIRNRGETTGDTGLTILGHEAGHLFLAFASIRDPADYRRRLLLKPDGAHWSFNFNSEASLLEGNRIRDNGDGTFTTAGAVEGYSALDQYLMGLRDAEEVPPSFVVLNSSINAGEPPSARAVTFIGARRDVTVDELARAEGLRRPGPGASQRRFRCAFVLIVQAGVYPDDAELEKLEDYRLRFGDAFAQWTGGRASMDTTLRRAVAWSLAPAAGVLAGRAVTATLTIQAPAAAPLHFTLRRESGAASTAFPASVTIPAGAVSATFEVAGLAAGVDDLLAQPSDPAYETAAARVRVSPSPASLRLSLAAAGETVRVRVTDADNVPYDGVRVRSSAAAEARLSQAGGLVELARGVAGELSAHIEGSEPLAIDGIVNAASFVPGLSPGGFAAIFGRGLTAAAAGGLPPYPAETGGVRVWIDGKPAGLHYASATQANLVLPERTGGGARDIFVSSASGSAALLRRQVDPAAPGIFAVVRAGGFLEIYCTGLGENLPVGVIVGGRRLSPAWSGPHPSYPGLYQVNVEFPAGLTGEVDVSIEAGEWPGNQVAIVL
jgi:hypothetical protein